jgi:xylulose-5-phosphate/fructose-6-phosphate phosphoketolase
VGEIWEIQYHARAWSTPYRPRWPMIVLRWPKGLTGPKELDGLMNIEGTFRAYQVPILVGAAHPGHPAPLESWMRSDRAEELFDKQGRLIPETSSI